MDPSEGAGPNSCLDSPKLGMTRRTRMPEGPCASDFFLFGRELWITISVDRPRPRPGMMRRPRRGLNNKTNIRGVGVTTLPNFPCCILFPGPPPNILNNRMEFTPTTPPTGERALVIVIVSAPNGLMMPLWVVARRRQHPYPQRSTRPRARSSEPSVGIVNARTILARASEGIHAPAHLGLRCAAKRGRACVNGFPRSS